MAEALASAFVKTKFGNAETSVALYAAAGNCRDIVAAGLSRNTMSEMERELAQLLRPYLLGFLYIEVVLRIVRLCLFRIPREQTGKLMLRA